MSYGVKDHSNDLSVRPRKPVQIYAPIVVVDGDGNAHYELDDSMRPWTFPELIQHLYRNWPKNKRNESNTTPIMLVTQNPHREFLRAYNMFGNDPEWQSRISVRNDGPSGAQKNMVIGMFGLRDQHRHSKYFHPISPLDFLDDFHAYGDEDWPEWLRLYKWGGSVRKWMREQKLRFSPTRGGLAAQLLRDERFYSARRKVPMTTNEKAREAMPGNYYAIARHKDVSKLFGRVYLIDQKNAHHYAARTVALPNANSLFARGRYRNETDSAWTKPGSDLYESVMQEHGLLQLRVNVPNYLKGALPPWARHAGLTNIYIYTNELPLLRALKIEIRHIIRAWTSPDIDQGLSLYAEWAERESERLPEQRPWLKPTLLSAYGVLGAHPRRLEIAYSQSNKGEDHTYLLRTDPIPMKRLRTDRMVQSPIANTVHRGMIEAETRRLSIELARSFEADGHSVLAIHADAVLILDEGQQLPLLTPPWRVKDLLSRFQMLDSTSFKSQELTILPGRKKG